MEQMLAQQVESKIREITDQEIESEQIGEFVIPALDGIKMKWLIFALPVSIVNSIRVRIS